MKRDLRNILTVCAALSGIIFTSCTFSGGDSLASVDSSETVPAVTSIQTSQESVSASVCEFSSGKTSTISVTAELDSSSAANTTETEPSQSDESKITAVTEEILTSSDKTTASEPTSMAPTIDRKAPTTVTTVTLDPHTAILPTETTVLAEMKYIAGGGN